MAEVTTINIPQADFVTTTLNGAISNSATSMTIGTGLNLDANGGFLQIDYDSTAAVGVDNGPETIAYTSYNTSTGAVTGITRAQAGTTAVAHSNTASVQAGPSAKYFLNGTTLGYEQITTNFTSTVTPTTTDITGLTTTVTVPAGGRRIRITGFIPYVNKDTNAGDVSLFIRESATGLSKSVKTFTTTSSDFMAVSYSAVPSAGSHTYKLSFAQSSAGTYTAVCDATYPAYILVELI